MSVEEQTNSERGTVYVVAEGKWSTGDIYGTLLRDSGEAPWSHMSSNDLWLRRDLTESFGRKAQLEEWYPNGYDVVFLGPGDDIPADVLERNKAWAPESTKQDDESLHVK